MLPTGSSSCAPESCRSTTSKSTTPAITGAQHRKTPFLLVFFLTNKKKELFSIFFWLRFVCQSSETQVHPTEATVILPSFTEFLFFFWSKMGGTVPRLIYLQVILAIKQFFFILPACLSFRSLFGFVKNVNEFGLMLTEFYLIRLKLLGLNGMFTQF